MNVINNEIKDKIVLLRTDYNVPIEDNKIKSDFRIKVSIPTIEMLLKNNNKVVIMSHLGRPDGKEVDSLRLNLIAKRLSELLNHPVKKYDKVLGLKDEIKNTHSKVMMLENLRFEKGEEENDEDFSYELSSYGDVYVFDAFSVAHRKHASTYGITNYLDNYIGLQTKKELGAIHEVLEDSKKPFSVIMGGAKLSSKLPVIKEFIEVADNIIIGGAMVFTFLKAMGYEIGESLYEESFINEARKLLDSNKIRIPESFVCLENNQIINRNFDKIKGAGLDINKDSLKIIYDKYLKNSNTILWNGPMGKFEDERFSIGTYYLAKELSKLNTKIICGGGETLEAIENLKLEDKFYFVSTGGGALLKFIEKKSLPVFDKLDKNE